MDSNCKILLQKKKDGNEYCGTHVKGTPHGIVDTNNEIKINTQKVEVWAQDIQGIISIRTITYI